MSAIRLQFVLGADWSSRLIAWYGQGYGGFSHVDAVLADGSLLGARSDSVGGKPPGVQVRPHAYAKWKRREVIELDCSALTANRYYTYLESQIGAGYDTADILGLIVGQPIKTPGHWICSAVQFESGEESGALPYMPDVEPQQITPDSLRLMFLARGARIT